MTDHAVVGNTAGARLGSYLAALVALCLLLPLHALAAGTAKLEVRSQQSTSKMDISWRDTHMRLDLPGQSGGYMVVRGDKAYSVTQQQGQTMVLDMSSLKEMGQAGNKGGEVQTNIGSLDEFEATGEKETVAGLEGEVYRVAWTDPDGETHQDTAVLSDNAIVRDMTDAFRRATEAMGGEGTDPFADALRERDAGVLRFADDFRVLSVSDEAPSAGDFELPAEPMSLQDMMREQMGQNR